MSVQNVFFLIEFIGLEQDGQLMMTMIKKSHNPMGTNYKRMLSSRDAPFHLLFLPTFSARLRVIVNVVEMPSREIGMWRLRPKEMDSTGGLTCALSNQSPE